jgi:hypothetical protein
MDYRGLQWVIIIMDYHGLWTIHRPLETKVETTAQRYGASHNLALVMDYNGLWITMEIRGNAMIWGCLQEHKPARSPPGHLEAIRRLSVIHGARESMSPALPRRASAVEDFTCLGSGPQGCAAQPQLRLTWITMDYHGLSWIIVDYSGLS